MAASRQERIFWILFVVIGGLILVGLFWPAVNMSRGPRHVETKKI